MNSTSENTKLSSFLYAGQSLGTSASVHRFSRKLFDGKFAVYDATQDHYRPIPASTRCLLLAEDFWHELVLETGRVLEALNKVATWMRLEQQEAVASRIFAPLCPIEKDAAYGRLEQHTGSATVRFDLFLDGDKVRILEINTTIPAMQAYSDIIAESYLAAGSMNSVGDGEIVSNTMELLESLREHYAAAGGGSGLSRIAIVARAGDSQLGELLHYQAAWKKLGYAVNIVTPETLRIVGSQLHDDGGPFDLVYRHVFASRVDPDTDFGRALRRSSFYKIFNPVSGHLEVKALFAELSRVGDSEGLAREVGLTDDEMAAVRSLIPWTRVLIAPEQLDDIVARRDRLVLKKSHGYGGHGVILGHEFDQEHVQKQVRSLMGVVPGEEASRGQITFREFLAFCCGSKGDVWIVQDLVPGVVLENEVLMSGHAQSMKTYIDLSLFGNSGVAFRPRGAAARIGSHQIVNIGRGGGMMPVMLVSK